MWALLWCLAQQWQPLFDGQTLAGWKAVGDARWTVADGVLQGAADGGRQSFLITEREYGDFSLELEVKIAAPGNSGVQLRSRLGEDGRLRGYQIEVDPSARAWSGGLYDEGRRGWLQNLEGRERQRQAFQPGAWNRYRIECRGVWIRSFVNDVPVADYLDAADLSGIIGLQVHSGKDTVVQWRNLRILDHGQRSWQPLLHAAAPELRQVAGAWSVDGENATGRQLEQGGLIGARFRQDGVALRLRFFGAPPLFFAWSDQPLTLAQRFGEPEDEFLRAPLGSAGKPEQWNEAWVIVAHGRLAWSVNGARPVVTDAGLAGPAHWHLGCGPMGAAELELRELQQLGMPRLRDANAAPEVR